MGERRDLEELYAVQQPMVGKAGSISGGGFWVRPCVIVGHRKRVTAGRLRGKYSMDLIYLKKAPTGACVGNPIDFTRGT